MRFGFLILLSIIISFNSVKVCAANIDSIKYAIEISKLDTNRVNLLYKLSYYYIETDIDSAFFYANEALKQSNKLGFKLFIAYSYMIRGNVFEYNAQYPKALSDYHTSEKLFEELKDSNMLSVIYTTLANIYEILGEYDISLDYHFRALNINEKLKRMESVSVNLSNIGMIYMNTSNYTLALNNFRKALLIDSLLNRIEGLSAVYNNIGVLFIRQFEFDSALVYLFKSLDFSTTINDKYSIINTKKNINNIYAQIGKFDEALILIEDAYKLSIAINNTLATAEVLISYGFTYYTMTIDSIISKNVNKREILLKKPVYQDSSIYFLDKAYEIIERLGLIYYKAIIYNIKADIYYSKNDFQKAYEFKSSYTIIKDSLNNMENELKIKNLTALREIEQQQMKIENYELEKKAQKRQTFLLSGGLIFVLITLAALFMRFKEKKKLNEKLEIQKNIVEYKNNQIYSSISYASTIQRAILPWQSILKKSFSDVLVFYKPKDIVSGDSYWFKEVDGVKYIAVIDCTGHGIPGSMLTVIASSVLDDAVLSKRLKGTNEILTFMNEKVTEVLNQRLAENSIRDGMEVALVAIHAEKIQFSGARRPLFFKNGTFNSVKTDRREIAGKANDEVYNFSSVEIPRTEDFLLYLTTDGFADQMNEDGKKYSTKRFINLLESISGKPISVQNKLLETEFNNHRGDREQIDDVTILGVKL